MPDGCGVIQFVTLRLKQLAQTRSLTCSGHAAPSLDGVPNAPYFDDVLPGNRRSKGVVPLLQVRNHGHIDLADRRFRHHLPELA